MIIVAVPVLNEEKALKQTIENIRKSIKFEHKIFCFDNGSTDDSINIEKEFADSFICVREKGKGNVVREIFSRCRYIGKDDIIIMIDGDNTYDLSKLNDMIEMVINDEADMVVGDRMKCYYANETRPFHKFGNKCVIDFVNFLFNSNYTDIMSGLRVFNRKFIRSMKLHSRGFEIETEMSIHAILKEMRVEFIDITYTEREADNPSKLRTFRDGFRVLNMIIKQRIALEQKKKVMK